MQADCRAPFYRFKRPRHSCSGGSQRRTCRHHERQRRSFFSFFLITLCVHPKLSLRDPLPQHSIMVFALDGKGSRQSARRFLERSLTHRTQWDSLITGETYTPMLEKRERQIAAPPSTDSNAQGIPAAGARNDEF